jgi:hypothetical protein
LQIHYFLWIIPMVGGLYFFYSIGLWWVSALALAIYIPTYINKDEFKKGRPWNALRNSSLWRLTSRYIGVEVVRTHKIDPQHKYMFGVCQFCARAHIPAELGGAAERCSEG